MNTIPVKAWVSLIFIGLLFTTSVQADAVKLNITARIVPTPCTVSPVLVAGQPVSLGQLNTSAFQNRGDADPNWHTFSLELTDCPAASTTITATFSGTPDSSDATLFANTSAVNPATSMAVEVSKQSNNSAIISNGSTMTVNVNNSTHTASFPLAARMKTPLGSARGGDVAAMMLVEFTYP